jgi:hypothetical protein
VLARWRSNSAKLNRPNKIPRNAILVTVFTFGIVTILYFMGLASQGLFFELAGISFFFSYILSVLAYVRRTHSMPSRLFGIAALLFVVLVFVSFGNKILYPLVVFLVGLGLSVVSDKQKTTKNAA